MALTLIERIKLIRSVNHAFKDIYEENNKINDEIYADIKQAAKTACRIVDENSIARFHAPAYTKSYKK